MASSCDITPKVESDLKRSDSELSIIEVIATDISVRTREAKRQKLDDDTSELQMSNSMFVSDDSEDDDNSEDEASANSNFITRQHSETNEAYPLHAAYHQDRPKTIEEAQSVVQTVMGLLSVGDQASEDVQRLIRKARDASQIPSPSAITIALLGDAGTGKSSLINSILDIPNVAKTAAIGSSCTCVAVEYHKPFGDQINTYGAKIQYFPAVIARELFEEHITNWNDFYNATDKDWAAEVANEMRLQATTCVTVLGTLFSNRPGFDSPGAITSSLQQNFDGDMTLIDQLAIWIEEILADRTQDDTGIHDYTEFETTTALQEHLKRFMSSPMPTRGEIILWPLVKKISIGIRGPRILDHINLTDLPGISDTNQTRVNASNEYLKECDALWIVARIDRVTTDRQVDGILERFGERFEGRLAVICTRSEDDMYGKLPDLARDLRDMGQSIGDFYEFHEEFKRLNREVGKLQRRIRKASKARRSQRSLEIPQLTEERTKAKRARYEVDVKRFASLVDSRNNNVSELFKQAKGEDLQVFCVSNLQYSGFRNPEELKGLPQLGPEDTGIPQLRAYALSLPAPAIWKKQEEYMAHTLAALLKALEVWANRVPIKNRTKLLSIFKEPQKEVTKMFDLLVRDLADTAEKELCEPLISSQDRFISNAEECVKNWDEWHWSQLRAFIRYYGKHSTKMIEKRSWNEEIMKPATKMIKRRWRQVKCERRNHMQLCLETITQRMESALKDLDAQPDAMSLNMTGIRQLVRAHTNGVGHAFTKFHDDYEKEDSNIKLDATQDRPTSPFSLAMRPAYKTALEDSGPGIKARWYGSFKTYATLKGDRSPFTLSVKGTVACIDVNTVHQTTILNKTIMALLKDLEDEVRSGCDVKRESDPAEDGLRLQIAAFLPEANASYENIAAKLASIEKEVELEVRRRAT